MGEKPKTKFALGDYVEVSERIQAWYDEYPEGRIETDIVTMTEKIVVTRSRVYKTHDATEPPAGIGHSMLGIPGKTPYTKDSELENCETSSVGRALVMAGIPSKQIASGHEIRNKRQEPEAPKPPIEPVDPERRARDDAWVADCTGEIARAADMPALLEIAAQIGKQNGYVRDKIRPVYVAKNNVLKSQEPATAGV